ncbi:MarR family winged helix-turn-helix transcriptional regulator [Leucobacter sp. M11]|uniref:MarR family winged helix-turn-helix transcriptional regulator n=1 Tax=Leucobacter sp. M11 TaxID=2993565 RepID=UPI002D7F0A4A|nr:MarR family transcriptional regulator [Leucobacter sp. M11]MEB4615621.1 MarR family transcriptional regulator [Leucobacter sp. M11]
MTTPVPEQSTHLRMATLRLARRLRAEKASEDLSDAQFSVLAWLHLSEVLTLGQLAERDHVSPPSMNRTVNFLEELGYLRRRANELDRRKTDIVLTPEGTAFVIDTIEIRDAWLERRMRELTVEQRAILAQAADLMKGIAAQ